MIKTCVLIIGFAIISLGKTKNAVTKVDVKISNSINTNKVTLDISLCIRIL